MKLRLLCVAGVMFFCGSLFAAIIPGSPSGHVTVDTGIIHVDGATFSGTVNTDTNIRHLTSATDKVGVDTGTVQVTNFPAVAHLASSTDKVGVDTGTVQITNFPSTLAHVTSVDSGTVQVTNFPSTLAHVTSVDSGTVQVTNFPTTVTATIADSTATDTWINLALTSQNQEYTVTLSSKCVGYEFQCRSASDVKWGKAGDTGTQYWTLKSGYTYSTFAYPNYNHASETLAFQSATGSVVLEIHVILKP